MSSRPFPNEDISALKHTSYFERRVAVSPRNLTLLLALLRTNTQLHFIQMKCTAQWISLSWNALRWTSAEMHWTGWICVWRRPGRRAPLKLGKSSPSSLLGRFLIALYYGTLHSYQTLRTSNKCESFWNSLRKWKWSLFAIVHNNSYFVMQQSIS